MNKDAEEKKGDLTERKATRSHRDSDNDVPAVVGSSSSTISESSVQVILSVPFTSQAQSSILYGADEVASVIIQDKLAPDKGRGEDLQLDTNANCDTDVSSINVLGDVSRVATTKNSVIVAIPISSQASAGSIGGSVSTTKIEKQSSETQTFDGEDIIKELSTENAAVEVLPVNSSLVPVYCTDDIAKAEIDGKQYVVVADNTAALGLSALPSGKTEEGNGEPPIKKFKVQAEDGQSYILTLAGDVPTSDIGEDQMSEHQYQSKQPEVTELVGRAIEKRNQLLGSDVSQAWFTTRDDKKILQSSGATWKQGQWTKDEVDLLQININEYCRLNNITDPTEIIFEMSKDERKEFYRSIAKGLQRPLFSVYRRVLRMYDQKNHMGKYSPEEISKLRELRRKHGNDWATIGQALGRSSSSVKDKCRLMKDTCNSGKWLPEEEKRLTQAVYELTGCEIGANVVHGLAWSRVAERVMTRSEKQCRTKWLNYMNWKQQGGKSWTREDDMNLIYRIASSSVIDETEIDWTELSKNWDSVRSPQWLRGKWWSLKRHIQDYQVIPFSDLLENMKSFYLHNVRARSTILSTSKGRKYEPGADTLAYIPIPLNGDLSNEGAELEELDAGVQAYEVLQQLPNSSASYIIAQPAGTDSLHNPLLEHIVVQTVPMTQGGDADLEIQNRVVIRVPSSSDLNVTSLEPSDLGTSIAAMQLPMDQEQPGFKMTELTEENGITHSDSLSDDSTFHSVNLESSVISSPSDVIGIKQEAFSQSESTNGRLMTSFSDPMLNSNSNSLIGPTADVEADKPNPDDIIGNM